MKSLNYWNQFLETGSALDYIQYKQGIQSDNSSEGDKQGAGSSEGYRSDIEDGAYRGI